MKEVFSYIIVFLIILISLFFLFNDNILVGDKIKLISSKETGKVVQEPEGDEPQQLREVGQGVYKVVVNNQIVASVKESNVNFNHKDRLGSNVVTSLNSVESKSKTLPFGQELLNPDHKFTFTGKELDESDFYYFNARYYDTNLGRFISTDPIMDNQPYAFSNNNPLLFIDPTGMDPYKELNKERVYDLNEQRWKRLTSSQSLTFGDYTVVSDFFEGELTKNQVRESDFISYLENPVEPEKNPISNGIVEYVAGTLYRESASLREIPGHPEYYDVFNLFEARVLMAIVAFNVEFEPGKVADPGVFVPDPKKPSEAWAWESSKIAANEALYEIFFHFADYSVDPNTDRYFYIRTGSTNKKGVPNDQPWFLESLTPKYSIGPFNNMGGGDVARGDSTFVDVYHRDKNNR